MNYIDRDTKEKFGFDFLEDIVSWIGKNLSPEKVFDEKDLLAWARDHNKPDDIFSDTELQKWAEDNDYIADSGND